MIGRHGMRFRSNKSGFTVVELLIVIVVIAILAAITIVAYNGVTSRARKTSVITDLEGNSKQLGLYRAEHGTYPTSLSANCPASPFIDSNYCLKLSPGNSIQSYTGTASTFGLQISNGPILYVVTDSTTPTEVTPLALTSPTAANITYNSATLGATITSDGGSAITAEGTCWGTSPAPTTNCVATGGTSTGAFTQAVTGLLASTAYYYRGFATNASGTAYSPDGTFTSGAVCFVAGTMISTPHGDLPIENLKAGDKVLSWKNGRVVVNEIKQTFVRRTSGYFKITTAGGTLFVTGAHPLLTTQGYKHVSDLTIGDQLIGAHGNQLVLSKTYTSQETTVYNFEVSDPHNYFANGFVVHNKPV